MRLFIFGLSISVRFGHAGTGRHFVFVGSRVDDRLLENRAILFETGTHAWHYFVLRWNRSGIVQVADYRDDIAGTFVRRKHILREKRM